MKVEIQPRCTKPAPRSVYRELVMALIEATRKPYHALVFTFENSEEAKIVSRLRSHLQPWSARRRYFGVDDQGETRDVCLRVHYRSPLEVEMWLEYDKAPQPLGPAPSVSVNVLPSAH